MADENENKTADPVAETVNAPENVNPSPEVTPPPVNPQERPIEVTKDMFDELVGKVEELTKVVTDIAPAPQDTVPTKRPWTHWGRG